MQLVLGAARHAGGRHIAAVDDGLAKVRHSLHVAAAWARRRALRRALDAVEVVLVSAAEHVFVYAHSLQAHGALTAPKSLNHIEECARRQSRRKPSEE